jgi:cytochrome P450
MATITMIYSPGWKTITGCWVPRFAPKPMAQHLRDQRASVRRARAAPRRTKLPEGTGKRIALLLGKGLMVIEGKIWKRQRRMIQPAFYDRAIECLAATITDSNVALQ